MHLSPRYGRTVEVIEADGFRPDVGSPGSPRWRTRRATPRRLRPPRLSEPICVRYGRTVCSSWETDSRPPPPHSRRPSIAFPSSHLHGGEQTFGAFDDVLRHAITKLSHLHLVSSDEHARRVIAMGEDPSTGPCRGPPGCRPGVQDRSAGSSRARDIRRHPVATADRRGHGPSSDAGGGPGRVRRAGHRRDGCRRCDLCHQRPECGSGLGRYPAGARDGCGWSTPSRSSRRSASARSGASSRSPTRCSETARAGSSRRPRSDCRWST